jgi:predicted nucleic acid-binding protein
VAESLVFDSGSLSKILHPTVNHDVQAWFVRIARKAQLFIPEIADYELRRELVRSGKTASIGRLDALESECGYLALDTPTMRRAAELWARMRNEGLSTAHPKSIDIDVILASQSLELQARGHEALIVTDNVKHISRMAKAKRWDAISSE